MAGVVNIRRDVDDKFYRYRMPVLLTKIEGKGNGIKTVVPNMSDVARALSRPPTYPTKFFGCELGAQTSFDEKNDRYIVNGAHDATKLRELLDGFIDKFVLCKSCKNPETDLIITKNEEIIRDCKACGERTGVDMRHKLTTFIVKNPPKNPKKSKSKKAGGSESPNGSHADGGASPFDGDAGAESDDELTKRIRAEAAELNTEAAIAKEDWSVDTSAEAVKARTKAAESAMANLTMGGDDDSDDDADSPYSQLGRWAQENRDGGPVEVYKKAEELGIAKKHKSVQVLAQSLFDENIVSQITIYAPPIQKERLVGVGYPSLIPSVPKILMAFYQVDILEEEVIKQWGTHVSKKYVDKDTSKRVRKASEPFLKWLDEAEDSDEDGDE
ncbi:hypothetical protein EW026_g4726 [Hermanssonia centrifuga]|uniref:W2 domain-containing protein n=1 Tax=Hermanssonia centrifuga TaxID=98765 RepID=A0A4S4KG93_9APHY|nr:hypothetical protein EW026_g4726 [Hermanssonia centrifuga]